MIETCDALSKRKFSVFIEPLLVVIGFVPFGDLLGYLRKSRGKDDRYFNDPDIKPQTNLTSKELLRFARDVACGMEFFALNKVSVFYHF